MLERKKAIIFDDDMAILEVCSQILEDSGFHAFVAPNVMNIMERVLDIMPDIILMDGNIPDIGGLEASKILKNDQRTAGIPIVFITANLNTEHSAEAAGVDCFLPKPFDLYHFEETIATYALTGDGA